MKRLFFIKIPTKEKCRFTVPPAVALLNYISCGILWWIFSKLEFSRGFLYVCIIYIAGRISAAVMAGDI